MCEYMTETKIFRQMTDPTSRQRGRPTTTETANVPQGTRHRRTDWPTLSRNVTLTLSVDHPMQNYIQISQVVWESTPQAHKYELTFIRYFYALRQRLHVNVLTSCPFPVSTVRYVIHLSCLL